MSNDAWLIVQGCLIGFFVAATVVLFWRLDRLQREMTQLRVAANMAPRTEDEDPRDLTWKFSAEDGPTRLKIQMRASVWQAAGLDPSKPTRCTVTHDSILVEQA